MNSFFRSPKTLAALAVGLAGALLVLYAWRLPPFRSTVESTDNAYVRGQVTLVSPKLAGYVTRVAVQDFQRVEAGELLVEIDPRSREQALLQARAQLSAAEAGLANFDQAQRSGRARIGASQAQVEGARAALDEAEANARRVESLVASGVVSQASVDQARAARLAARANLRQLQAGVEVSRQDLESTVVGRQSLEAAVDAARAALRAAEIDLQDTRVLAPAAGTLGEVGVRVGQYVAPGTQMATLVPAHRWIIANFKENQVRGMRVGQAVDFEADALPGRTLHGHVEGFSPATGSEFSVLKPDNATGNFTKVAQRLPVRVAIDPGQDGAGMLVPGMSVVVRIEKDAAAPG